MLSHQLKIPETNNGIAYWSLPSLNYLNHHKTHQAMLANFTTHLRLQVTVRMLLMFVQKIYAGAQCKTTKMTWHTSKQSSSSNSSLTFLHMPACCNVHLKSTIQFHQQIKINLPPSPLKLKKSTNICSCTYEVIKTIKLWLKNLWECAEQARHVGITVILHTSPASFSKATFFLCFKGSPKS